MTTPAQKSSSASTSSARRQTNGGSPVSRNRMANGKKYQQVPIACCVSNDLTNIARQLKAPLALMWLWDNKTSVYIYNPNHRKDLKYDIPYSVPLNES